MKTLLAAINSQYIHSNLAVWYLKACCNADCGEVEVAEYNINDSLESILSDIYLKEPDNVAFSCYIWNIEFVRKLTADLRKILPGLKIILGGPEVSYDQAEILQENQGVDYILAGEAELPFAYLLKRLNGLKLSGEEENGLKLSLTAADITDAAGTEKAISAQFGLCRIENLEGIPSPYTDDMLAANKGKIVYFETSRGCPYSCSYCLSSTISGLRYFSIDRVKRDLDRLMGSEVRQIKFVDRTFNASKSRSHEIFSYIIENAPKPENNRNGIKNYHFEIYPDLLLPETIELLSTAPVGLIQLECGIQSTNSETLKAVGRKTDSQKALANIAKLIDAGNMHIHVDLVAGLPFEDIESFRESFNNAYDISPHNIQLGFLKLLKGTELRLNYEKYAYVFRNYPPYEILRSGSMTYGDLNLLKDIEEVLERYYNSGRFRTSLRLFTETLYEDAFSFFNDFSRFNRGKGYLDRPQSSETLYTIMLEFMDSRFSFNEQLSMQLNELLKFDYLGTHISGQLPNGISPAISPELFKRSRSFYHNSNKIEKYLPNKKGKSAKDIIRKVNFELFCFDALSEAAIGSPTNLILYI